MKKIHHGVKGIISLFVALCMLVMVSIPAFAEDASVNQSVKDDRKGVVQVRLIYTDENGKQYPIQGGTGFLIGTDNTSTTVITNNHVIKLTDENAETMKYLLPGFDQNKVSVDVVVKGMLPSVQSISKGLKKWILLYWNSLSQLAEKSL